MISFSGGRTSGLMTIELLKNPEYSEDNTVICFANTGKENEETLEFVNKIDEYLGGEKIIWLEYDNSYDTEKGKYSHFFKRVDFKSASRKGEPFEKLIKVRRFIPNVVTRYCTQELKIRPIKKFMKSLGYKTWSNIVGIRFDEPKRYSNLMKSTEQVYENKAPLFEMKITKKDVIEYWEKMPFNLELDEMHGNCDLCFLKGMRKKLMILKDKPEIAEWWIEQEKKTGATFVKGFGVQSVLDKASKQMEILYEDSDYQDCFCNID